MSVDSVTRWIPELRELGTRVVLISGGEPLLNPDWVEIAGLLRAAGLRLWLLTSGLSLAKHAGRVAELFESVTVSLDGADAKTYRAIRGLDAFDVVCKGIRSMTDKGIKTIIRVTVQRANYTQLQPLVKLARQLHVSQISFLAADVSNPHAFGRSDGFFDDLGLGADDLPHLERVLSTLEREHLQDFRSGFIAESPQKLRRLLQYFSAIRGQASFPPTRCNAPEFSAVIAADSRVSPCFFIAGPEPARANDGLFAALNSDEMVALRDSIRRGQRTECKTCVCSMWRDPHDASTWDAPSNGVAGL